MARNTQHDNTAAEWAATARSFNLFGWTWNNETLRQERKFLGCTLAILRIGSQAFNAVLMDPTNVIVKNERQPSVTDAAQWLMEQTGELMRARILDDIYELRLDVATLKAEVALLREWREDIGGWVDTQAAKEWEGDNT